ncbi:BTAD domain-containing putative transcriptional regulator [Nocardia acidivorans]|uniref:BTAD domain-containing putative transcriptional regulator n=1 Tax=Nocardia acidivorans TaxID=404580 RepID=UPI0008338053|nr:BTAD domain-containing putative transcriptional regulator [Nocardia acidivorans]
MLIAVAGLHPAAGASTTALLLAAAWPTGQPVIVAEADPRGGQLARRCGGDPARGLASLTTAAGESGVYSLADLADHLQWHPAAVVYLAAPAQPDPLADGASSGFDLGRLGRMDGPTGKLVVVADCGLASPDSRAVSLLDSADVLLVVANQHHPGHVLAARVRELAARFPRLALVLTGASVRPDDLHARTAELGGRVIGWLPPPRSATEYRTPAVVDARDVGAYAHALATAVHVRAGAGSVSSLPVVRSSWLGSHRRRGLGMASPQVYAISACPSDIPARQRFTTASESMTPPPPTPPVASPPAQHHVDSAVVSERTSTSSAPHTPESAPAGPYLDVRLFGPLRIIWRPQQGIAGHAGSEAVDEIEITARLQPRSRELLVLLATHPHGLTRAQLVDALWGPQRPARPGNAVCTTLARLRNTLVEITGGTGQPLLETSSGRLRLNPAAVRVDYVEFAEAAARRRHSGDDAERRSACSRILELAAVGPLAAGLDTEFLDPVREKVRRDAIASISILACSMIGKDPEAALRLLESAIDIDPHNENFYRDMLRMYADLGQHYVIGNTVNLLERRLAEIGEKPSKRTRELAKQLENRAS